MWNNCLRRSSSIVGLKVSIFVHISNLEAYNDIQVILLQDFERVFLEIAFLKTATHILSTVLDQ
jgi:hypothetical protein